MLLHIIRVALFYALLLTSFYSPIRADRWKNLYKAIFSPTSEELSVKEVVSKVDKLRDKLTGMQLNTMRMFNVPVEQLQEVEFWVDIDDEHDSKCTPEFDIILEKRLERQCRKASEAMSRRDLPNLAIYTKYVREKQFKYCLKRFGPKLEKAIVNLEPNFVQLMEYLVKGFRDHELSTSSSLRSRIASNIVETLSNYYDSESCRPSDYDEEEFEELERLCVFNTCEEILSPCYKSKLARYAAYLNRAEYLPSLSKRVQSWLRYMSFCKKVDQEIIEYAFHKLPSYVCRRAKRNQSHNPNIREILQHLMKADSSPSQQVHSMTNP